MLGETISHYSIEELLGEGGMGVVYEARQREPLTRRVALKLVKAGMDSRELLARFAAERQVLARLQHPNIARVHDAGTTPNGRPYFVMELVEGRRIDEDCDQRGLPVRERVALVATLCRAMEHAHRRGVLHRDLKPSNVLVTDEAGQPLPKIIDFGIAKVLFGPSESDLATQQGGMLGTPEYMSPEQAAGRGDLDTRSDVYSLGVMLYQLVAGTLPFDSARLRSGPVEAQRILASEDVPAPAGRLAALGAEAEAVARSRGCSARALGRLLAGELRWVLARATEKDRERRYGSAAELASDLERYLRHEPVLAGPPSRAYRLRQLVRRHRLAVAAGFAVFVSLSAGLLSTGLALGQANRARREAEQHAAVAEAVNRFLDADLLGAGAPHQPGDRDLTVRELLDRAAARLEHGFDGPPVVEAGVRASLAEAYWGLGLREASAGQWERAAALRTRQLGPEHPDSLRALVEWGTTLCQTGRLAEAEGILADGLPAAQRALGPDHHTTLLFRRLEGLIARNRGRLSEAERTFVSLLEQVRRVDSDDLHLAEAANDLAVVQDRLGRPGAAERHRTVYEAYQRHYGDDHDQTALAIYNYGMALAREERLAEAEPLLRGVLERHRRILGPRHLRSLQDATSVSGLLRRLGRLPEARTLAEEACEGVIASGAGESFEGLLIRTNLARVLRQQGELGAAPRAACTRSWASPSASWANATTTRAGSSWTWARSSWTWGATPRPRPCCSRPTPRCWRRSGPPIRSSRRPPLPLPGCTSGPATPGRRPSGGARRRRPRPRAARRATQADAGGGTERARCSQALAAAQCRCTLRTELRSTSAASSAVSPPK